MFKRLTSSRKFQIGVASIIVAIAAEYGLDLSESTVLGILGVAGALIGGIALEDAARLNAAAGPTPSPSPQDSNATPSPDTIEPRHLA